MKTFCSAALLCALVACASHPAPVRKHDLVRIAVPGAPAGDAVLTAEVQDVRPNGRLLLVAKSYRAEDGNEEYVVVRGEVEPWAVVNRTVESSSMLNLRIVHESNGPLGSPVRLGWVMDKFWPF